ncbi:hypothetical protein [Amycolatopsis sp. H20-H5]|uniref:hypothetical protein n=1 Tax=Amycolatopsis sp. H20-H5 TaxID=3046309 RepID=UPI003FA38DF2
MTWRFTARTQRHRITGTTRFANLVTMTSAPALTLLRVNAGAVLLLATAAL